MKSRLGILVASILLIATVFVSCVSHESISQEDNKTRINVSQIAASTTSTTISWTDDGGDNRDYTISVYKDSECNELYQEYNLSLGAQDGRRFSVPYLNNNGAYYICVTNSLGHKSNTLEVILESETIRRTIISQNFDNLFWGYDYINLAHGVNLPDDIDPKLYLIENFSEAIEDSQVTTSLKDDGRLLFRYNRATLKLMGFENWPTTSKDVRILPGYIKLGTAFQDGILHTPKFTVLENDTEPETIDISFSAAIFSETLSASGGQVTAKILRGDGSELNSKSFNMKSVDGKPSWNNFQWKAVEGVTDDCYLEIRTTSQAKQVCIDNIKIVRHLSIPDGHVYGYVYDKASGEAIEGVAVSDGFSVVATNKDGLYTLKPHQDAMYIYYSVPADCEVIRSVTGPRFYTKISQDLKEYSFELTKLPNGKEDKFALFTFADPQVASNTALSRFKNEAVPAIREHSKSLGIPCYGITLGDIVSSSDKTNTVTFMDQMREAMRSRYTGMAVFQVMGNHDNTHYNAEKPLPIEPDPNGSNFEVKAQRAFEKVFGPINYSFNRGDVHIIGMRDIVYTKNDTSAKYTAGFLPEQYEWLKQDLALVPKDKMVVLCVHIPLYNYRGNSGEKGHYVKEVHELLNEYTEAHIISGHVHTQNNYEHTDYNIYEHNMGSVCGSWWLSNICGDGTPNGYGVFIGEGNTFSDWYYMGYAEGMNDRNYQMRLYRGNSITGTDRELTPKRKYSGYYQFNFGEEYLLANVFNADNLWKIEVYEDGIYMGDMERVEHKSVSFKDDFLVGEYTLDNPRRIRDGIEAPYEMWVAGIHFSLSDDVKSARTWTSCSHFYKFQLQDPGAPEIKVIAIDRFGNRYEETKITDYRDNDIAFKP